MSIDEYAVKAELLEIEAGTHYNPTARHFTMSHIKGRKLASEVQDALSQRGLEVAPSVLAYRVVRRLGKTTVYECD